MPSSHVALLLLYIKHKNFASVFSTLPFLTEPTISVVRIGSWCQSLPMWNGNSHVTMILPWVWSHLTGIDCKRPSSLLLTWKVSSSWLNGIFSAFLFFAFLFWRTAKGRVPSIFETSPPPPPPLKTRNVKRKVGNYFYRILRSWVTVLIFFLKLKTCAGFKLIFHSKLMDRPSSVFISFFLHAALSFDACTLYRQASALVI